jgi:outer membrane protein assembly factor BamD
MRSRLYILPLLILTATSCGEYEKILKSTDYELKKQKMYDYYDEGKYIKTTELLAQILPRYTATEEAENLNWINAQANYKLQSYELASTYFQNFANLYPASNNAEESLYLVAVCDYNMSPRAELDQSYTKKAIESFKIFLNKYPTSSKLEDCRTKMKELQERLVEKSYLSARLYYDMEEYRAATVSLANSLKEYPDTKYREELMYLRLDALYLYANQSIPSKQVERFQAALDEYYSFIEEFPKSKYLKDVTRIYDASTRYLKNVSNKTTTVNN